MSITFKVTTAGYNKIKDSLSNNSSISIGKFKIGSSNSYTPSISQSDIVGSLLYSDSSLNANVNSNISIVKVINNKNFKYGFDINLHLNGNVGNFDIGEYGLFLSDNTPLGFGVLSDKFYKRLSSSQITGNSLNLKTTIIIPAHTGSYTLT